MRDIFCYNTRLCRDGLDRAKFLLTPEILMLRVLILLIAIVSLVGCEGGVVLPNGKIIAKADLTISPNSPSGSQGSATGGKKLLLETNATATSGGEVTEVIVEFINTDWQADGIEIRDGNDVLIGTTNTKHVNPGNSIHTIAITGLNVAKGQAFTLKVLANVYATTSNDIPVRRGSVNLTLGTSTVQGGVLVFTGNSVAP